MRIKRIEIIGFKSFHDKTVLTINEPITAVVGPNGCGKSNIIDAIRWCMGEQSAKHLRGKAMEDVIFGGSETRAAAGMAEVSLTFEDVGLSIQASSHQPELASEALGDEESEAEILEDDEPGAKPAIDFSQYGEVTVTRRLYRDGGSDYFINKTPCRLRDIVDFFLGTGVGTKAYSIIEQGRVGMIVSSKPEDRRLILEEAAGITKFKKKKVAAERKMEQTRANLLRVADVSSEIEKQLASLRRQAQKAERYKKYRAEVRDLEIWSAAHRFLGVRAEEGLLLGQLAEVQAGRAEAEHAHLTADATVVAERAESAVEERRLAELTQIVFDLENRLRLGESQVDYQGREARDLEERAAAAASEIDGLRRQLEDGRSEAARVESESARLEGESAARAGELARLDGDLTFAREELTVAASGLDGARAEIGRAQTDIARLENNVRSLDRRRTDLEVRAGRLAEEEGRAATRGAELLAETAAHEQRLSDLKQSKAEREQQRVALESRVATVKVQHGEADADVRRLDADLAKRRSRLQSLKEIQNKYEGFARGTRAIMKHRAADARGLCADIIRATPEVETAVEAVLGERLGAILVETQEVGASGVGFLKQRTEGRSTFIPLAAFGAATASGLAAGDEAAAVAATASGPAAGDEAAASGTAAGEGAAAAVATATGTTTGDEAAAAAATASGTTTGEGAAASGTAAGEGGVAASPAMGAASTEGVASVRPSASSPAAAGVGGALSCGSDIPADARLLLTLVDCAEGHRAIVGTLLQDVLVVDTLPRALELWQSGLRHTFVTLDGDLVDRAGLVTGGSRDTAGAGILGQKREIRELEELVQRLGAELEAAQARQVALRDELTQSTATLEVLRKDSHQGELAILTSEKDLVRWRSEAERLNERRAQLGRERTELDAALSETMREAEETTIALGGARGRADDAERRQLGLIEGVTISRRNVDDALARVTECKVRVAQVGAERAAFKSQLSRLEDSARELVRRIEKLERTVAENSARVAELRVSATTTAAELAELRTKRLTHAEELAAGRSGHEARLAALQEQELTLRTLRQRLEKLSAEQGRLEVRLAALEGERRHIVEAVVERYRVDLPRELFEYHLRPPVGDAETARIAELRELIERMGEINLTAIEEFEELSKRYEFLVGQKADLEGALGQLEKAIAKINKVSRRRFRETFDAVNAKFKEIFPRLFRGGRAELRLVGGESDDQILDAGVEILAQPPGKKNATVELLSGGEKALTAVSLIFSIFLIKPSPFCILDEVDAPLDEANVGRYNDMVREMTDRSQFIVITHNKRTMEIADTLFGITMEEPGCSKLVNVNLRTFGDRKAA